MCCVWSDSFSHGQHTGRSNSGWTYPSSSCLHEVKFFSNMVCLMKVPYRVACLNLSFLFVFFFLICYFRIIIWEFNGSFLVFATLWRGFKLSIVKAKKKKSSFWSGQSQKTHRRHNSENQSKLNACSWQKSRKTYASESRSLLVSIFNWRTKYREFFFNSIA